MRCDLHVHTKHSGMCTIPFLRRVCRESYNEPLAVYDKLKRLGMDLVTVTDHDSIDAAEALRSRPDFFLSEEATCRLPSGTELHIGIYDITERDHVEIQRRRNDFESLTAWLCERNLLFSANHVFSSLTGRRHPVDFELFESVFPALETRNGHMLARANENAATLADFSAKAEVGGSDAHAMASVGCAWTVVPRARSRQEYLEGLRRGLGKVRGVDRRLLEADARHPHHRRNDGAPQSVHSPPGAAGPGRSVVHGGELRRGEPLRPLVDGPLSARPSRAIRLRIAIAEVAA